MKLLCRLIWDFAERNNVDLGWMAPWVFGGMIGSRPRRKQ